MLGSLPGMAGCAYGILRRRMRWFVGRTALQPLEEKAGQTKAADHPLSLELRQGSTPGLSSAMAQNGGKFLCVLQCAMGMNIGAFPFCFCVLGLSAFLLES